MNETAQRFIDVSGLPEEAVVAVESLVSVMRGMPQVGPVSYDSRAEWARAVREWAASHPVRDEMVEDSRENIYAGRGE
jgi:hypothetical protein